MTSLWTLCALWLGTAHAEARTPILRVEGPSIYVPLGAADGLHIGQEVTLYRAVTVIDPRTGRALSDHFPVGTGVVRTAGDTLSRIYVSPQHAIQLEAGDMVGLEAAPRPVAVAPPPKPRPTPEPAVAPTPQPTASPPPMAAVAVQTEVRYQLSEEAQAFQEAFGHAAGTPRAERLDIWTTWLEDWSASPMADAVRSEVASLRRAPSAAPGLSPLADDLSISITSSAPQRIPEHTPAPVVLTTPSPDAVRSATLFYRLAGEATFRHTAFQPIGDTSWSASIPAEATLLPGIEWFAEVRDDQDALGAVGGSAQRPVQMTVSDMPEPVVIEDRSQATLLYEYVDFYAGSRADYYHHAEADFVYRINRPVFYSMRLGAGTYRGMGGVTEELDALGTASATEASEPVGYNFGYTELEFKLSPWFAVISRGMVGIDYLGLAGGAEGRIRLGREEGTSLDAGAARIGRVGTRYALGLDWSSVERVPMGATIEVTDFPGVARVAGPGIENYGVRLIYDARYAFSDSFELGGRVGWSLRNIDHAGPSGGLQAVFSW